MQNAITISAPPPKQSLTIQAQMQLGMNQIRRSLGSAVSLYTDDLVVNSVRTLPAGGAYDIADQVSAFIAVSSGDLDVTVNNVSLSMHRMLVLDNIPPIDQELGWRFTFTNNGSDEVQLNLSYAATNPSP